MTVFRNRFGFYPSAEGVPISPDKIWLPNSKLDLSNPENFNNHHNYWPKRIFGKHVLYRTLRDLACHQFLIPKDVHEYLHASYSPPKLPSPTQALLEITRAISAGDRLYSRENGENTCRDIGEEVIRQVFESYNELQIRQRDHDKERLSLVMENMLIGLEPQDAIILSLYRRGTNREQ